MKGFPLRSPVLAGRGISVNEVSVSGTGGAAGRADVLGPGDPGGATDDERLHSPTSPDTSGNRGGEQLDRRGEEDSRRREASM